MGFERIFGKEDERKIIALYEKQMLSMLKIGKVFNCGEKPIRKVLMKNNINISLSHRRKILFSLGKIKHPLLGKKHSPETIKKQRLAKLGKKNPKCSETKKRLYKEGKLKAWNKGMHFPKEQHPMYGKHHSEETKRKIREKRKYQVFSEECRQKKRKYLRKKWKEEDFARKMINGFRHKPNKPEKIMINLIKENNFPLNYTGNGEVIIGGFCPDFVCNPSKKIIEVFGDYWHNLPKLKERDQRRFKAYKKHGFETLVIWEHELTGRRGKKLSGSDIKNKIRRFLEWK